MMLNVHDVVYHVEVVGQGEPLVLLHGFTGSGASWFEHVPVFAQDFQVVTIDLLGHGQTDAPDDAERYRIEHAANDLVAIFEQLRLSQVHLLGYSMGGRLAVYTVVHHSQHIRSMILESASPGLKTFDERQARVKQDERLATMIEAEGIEQFVDYWENLPLFGTQSAEIRAQLHQQRLHNNPLGLANSLRGMGTGVQPSLWEHLNTLSLPICLIAGALDTKFSNIAQNMHALLPDSQLFILASAGHTTHLEQPEPFRQTIIEFLK